MTESDIDQMALAWLEANKKHPNEVRYGHYPIGFVVRWIERAKAAEEELRNLNITGDGDKTEANSR